MWFSLESCLNCCPNWYFSIQKTKLLSPSTAWFTLFRQGKAWTLGIHLVKSFLSMKPLHGQTLLCHLLRFDLTWNVSPWYIFIFKYLNIVYNIFNKIGILKHSHIDKYFPNTFLYYLGTEFKLCFTLKGKSEFWGINYHIFMLFMVIIYL